MDSIGFIFFGIGSLVNFATFAYAAQSTIAAISGVQFVSNLFFSYFLHGEEVKNLHYLATLFLVSGVCLAAQQSRYSKDFQRVKSVADIYALYSASYFAFLFFLGFICILGELTYKIYDARDEEIRIQRSIVNENKKDDHKYNDSPLPLNRLPYASLLKPFSFSTVSTIIGTQAVLQSKCIAELIRSSIETNDFVDYKKFVVYVIFASFLGCISFWIYRLQIALSKFNGVFIIPLLQSCWIVTACIQGAVFFHEFTSSAQVIQFSLGVALILLGVIVLGYASRSSVEEPSIELNSTSEALALSVYGERTNIIQQHLLNSGFPLSSPLRASSSWSRNEGHTSSSLSNRSWSLVVADELRKEAEPI